MKKPLSKSVAAVLSVLALAPTLACIPASAEQTDTFAYAMFAGSSTEGAITIDADWLTLNGNIASNGTISGSKHMNLNGEKTENAGKDMLFVGSKLDAVYFNDAELAKDLALADTNVSVNTDYDVAGSVAFNGNVCLNSSVKSDYDVTISGNTLNANNAVLFSEFGDIIIDSDNVNFNGLIYAPLGNVEIDANNINLNNTIIIADTITLHASNINANYNQSLAKTIGTSSESKAAYITKYNTSVMEKDIQASLDLISQYYKLTPVETGKYGKMNIMNMIQFDVFQYDIEGIGNLSIMKAEGMAQMTTYVLTPYDKDLPLVSLDFMYNEDQRISYVEYYDLTENKESAEYQSILAKLGTLSEKYTGLADTQVSSAWYDDLRTVGLFKASDYRSDETTSQMLLDSIQLTLESAKSAHNLNEEEKAVKLALNQQYADNLVDIGGVATNMFKMAMGPDVTKDFFNSVFFGTYRYQK